MNAALAAATLAMAVLVDPAAHRVRARLAVVRHRPQDQGEAVAGGNHRSARLLPVLAGAAAGGLGAALGGYPAGLFAAPVVAVLGWFVARRTLASAAAGRTPAEPLRLAAGWDLLAACLCAGLPVPNAVRAVAASLPDGAARALGHTAELIALGADPVEAWAPAIEHPQTTGFARGARRTAKSGTALANVATALAAEVRAGAADLAEARAQRAAVLVSGPLGLCFLPAFLCLGVVPVVIGLAGELLDSW